LKNGKWKMENAETQRGKEIPLCAPGAPNSGAEEKAALVRSE